MTTQRNILLVVGEDDFLVDRAARDFLERNVPADVRATAVETVEGVAANATDQLAAIGSCELSLRTPPFLDPVKLTWWRGVAWLPGGEETTADVRRRLEKFAFSLTENPPPANQFLLVTAPKLLSTSVVAKSFKQAGEMLVYAAEKNLRNRQGAAFQRLEELAAAEKLVFKQEVAWAFVAKVGTDTRTIVSELAKMRTYLGDERDEVTLADVTTLCAAGDEEPDFWELTDAVARRDAKKAAALLDQLSDSDPTGMLMATLLEKKFREMIVHRDAVERGWLTPAGWSRTLPEGVVDLLARAGAGPKAEGKRAWAAGKNADAAKRFTLAELRVARWRMLKTREALSSGAGGGPALVKTNLLRFLAKKT